MQREETAGPVVLCVPTMLCVRYQCCGSGISCLETAIEHSVSLIGAGSTLGLCEADKLEPKGQWLAEGQNP